MTPRRCFLTVGSTKFDELISEIISRKCVEALRALGITHVTIQSGSGNVHIANDPVNPCALNLNGIHFVQFAYKDSLEVDMRAADVIIGHAGAGTCLEALRLQKPLIVVVNENLMGNHQLELAERLAAGSHVFFTSVQYLHCLLCSVDFSTLKPFAPSDMKRVAYAIDKWMGIE